MSGQPCHRVAWAARPLSGPVSDMRACDSLAWFLPRRSGVCILGVHQLLETLRSDNEKRPTKTNDEFDVILLLFAHSRYPGYI